MNDHHAHSGGHGHVDTTGGHGMLLFGEEVLYMSHLPMFDSPHNFQVLLEIELDDAVRSALRSHDHTVPGENYDTFIPEDFPIVELDPHAGPARTSITGTIFCGHFERKGKKRGPVAKDVVARVHRVVLFNELDVNATPVDGRKLTYLCFGRAGQLYLAHEITARPNFDHVLAVRALPGTTTDQAGRPLPDDAATLDEFFREAFELATPVQFGRSDDPGNRLAPPEIADGLFFQTSPPSGFHGFRVQLEIERELYLEIDELT
jgi:hypothetical protein